MTDDRDLFGNPANPETDTETTPAPRPKPSTGALRTSRQRIALAGGRHPLQGQPLPGIEGATCGNCAHRRDNHWRPDKYRNCALAPFPGQRGPVIPDATPLGRLLHDLDTILNTTQEPRHD